MSRAVITVEKLSKKYRLGVVGATTLREDLCRIWTASRSRSSDIPNQREFWALRDVTFTVEPGQVVGIIGRNGAGKSTLLKILSRITEPTGGQARLRGRVGSLLEVGTGFHPELTGRENVFLNGAILGMKNAEIASRLDQIVSFAEVDRFLDTPVKHYSSGMRVRLAFAVTAHLDAEIMIVDEVLAVGDAAFQRKCLLKMQETTSQFGRTVLFVSHNLEHLRTTCSRGIVLKNGVVTADAEFDRAAATYLQDVLEESQSATVDLPSSNRELRVRLERITLVNSIEGQFSARWTEPLRLRIDATVLGPIREVRCSLGITTPDGYPVCTMHSTDNACSAFNLEPGRTHIDVEIRHSLRIGTYFLALGVSSGPETLFFSPRVAVLTLVHAEGVQYDWNNPGFMRAPSSWTVSTAS